MEKTMMKNHEKYLPFAPVALSQRKWPGRTVTQAPAWCSVDLRDGNQALPIPMNVDEKVSFFKLLTDIGFKEIEVGFPSASEIEYDFTRRLIDGQLIPGDVYIQALVQCREHLIRRTFESLAGVKKAVVHFYNSTSTLQRKVVFQASRREIMDIAVNAAGLVRTLAEEARSKGADIICEYSPESFSGTEGDYAIEICEAVLDTLGASRERPVIINLPNTVEMASPNIYADQIEYFLDHVGDRERIILSVHPHNDRGTAVAAAELAMLAGAERVEGTLFGNGERTGNVDIITLAMNLHTQGVDSKLHMEDINYIRKVFERCTRMKVHERQPYAGDLVYTAFSGSHQDAISKGLAAIRKENSPYWNVPYLPIDPADLGRQYEPIIRINSQSGKGGAAFIMENDFGYRLPKAMHPEFGRYVQKQSEVTGRELTSQDILEIFYREFVYVDSPYRLISYKTEDISHGAPGMTPGNGVGMGQEEESSVRFVGFVEIDGVSAEVEGMGNGPLDAFYNALQGKGIPSYDFISYDQHALSTGSDSRAIAYIQLKDKNGRFRFGVGTSKNINKASMRALLCAINRMTHEEN
jgi:2-isopropylmalate synthase